ncbi:MAG: hypothetical protein Q8O19_03470, partial [Rectinemataceae bacterium]|nr:hypothetical protein [Rectinemataceae bacterium]
MVQLSGGVIAAPDEKIRGANPPVNPPAGPDLSSMEESKHFRVFYDKAKWPTVGPNNAPKEIQEPVKFAREVGTYLDHAWDEYHKNDYPRPFETECKAWDSIRTVPSSIPYPPRIDVTIDPSVLESETGTLSGKITLKFDYESMDEVRHDAAHEVFHIFQQSLFSRLSSLAQQGYVARHWWMEATADYAADKIAWGGLGTMAKPNLEYFKVPLNTADSVHDYATSRFIDYLVSQKDVVFKELWDASVANRSDNMVTFLETYLMKTTATTLHDHYKGFAEYTLFDVSSPLELKGSLFGVILTSGPYKGKRVGGPVEADTPPVLAADKAEISYVFSLSGGYTAKLWAFKAPHKDPKSSRTLKIEAIGNIPKASDVEANVYVLKNDQRLKGGVESNPDLSKGTINSTRKSMNLSVAPDEEVYILAVNTGASDQRLTVKVSDASLTISPPTASVDTGKNVTFTTPGVTEKVLWTVQEGVSGGTISPKGIYTAPDKPGPYHVVATLESDPSVTATATVTVATAKTNPVTSLKLELPGFWGHLSYTITGAQLDPPTGGDRGKIAGRGYSGKLAGNTLIVSGTAVSDNESSGPGSGVYYELVVEVVVG